MPSVTLRQWLSDPRRDYAVGLELFMKLASPQIREKYRTYLCRKPYPTTVNDHRMQLLTDRLRRLVSRANEAKVVEMPKQAPVQPANVDKPAERRAATRLKVVKYDELPMEQREQYDRIKELTPLRTQLKAELNVCKTDADRRGVASRLIQVDDELRSLWDKLDTWSNGEKKVEDDTPRPDISDNTYLAALQVAHRLKQIGDNIRSAKMCISRYTKEGNATLLERAQRRLERYEIERDKLEKHIAYVEQRH